MLHGLIRSGVSVPDQVSVIGFDDILTSRLVLPPLTTVAAPLRQMGATSVNNLAALLNGARPQASTPLVMPVRLRVRGSTGPRLFKRVSPARGTGAMLAATKAAGAVRPGAGSLS